MSVVGTIAVLVALGAGGAEAALSVESDSTCPSANAVREALITLGSQQAPPRPASVFVRNRADRLAIEFGWPGEPQAETREIAADHDCEARAQAAAVVIASWLGMLPETSLLSKPLAPPAEVGTANVAPPAPVVASVGTSAELKPAEAPPVEPPRRSWLGAGMLGSAGGGVVPGLRLELGQTRGKSTLDVGWMVGALVTMPRSRGIDQGTSHWIRPAFCLSGLALWQGRRVQVGLDVGPLLGVAVAWGGGYQDNATDASLTWGLTAGLRMQLVAASSRFWVELRIIDWPSPQSLQHEILPGGTVHSVDLPKLEGLLTLGWSYTL